MITAAALVAAVRGRRLCYELAQRSPGGDDIRWAMGGEVHQVHEARGDHARGNVAVLTSTLVDAGSASAPEPRPRPRLVGALAAVEAAEPSARDLLTALSGTVRSAMGWQPPHAEDVVLARDDVRAVLLPIAEAVLRAPGAGWWQLPLDRDTQVDTELEVPGLDAAAARTTPSGTPSDRLLRWRDGIVAQEREIARFRTRHPGERMGGTWWVSPSVVGLTRTTRSLGEDGSAALWLTEDDLGWETGDLVPCVIESTARVLEITGPTDWSDLVGTYPLDVTASRQPDWYETVAPREGRWLTPDWSAVARDHDAVHVSVLAWLLTSGGAVAVGPDATTTLAGWDPDATWWLADAPRPAGPGGRWVRDDERWVRQGRPRAGEAGR